MTEPDAYRKVLQRLVDEEKRQIDGYYGEGRTFIVPDWEARKEAKRLIHEDEEASDA